jgi:voltage-gated potassium channel
MCVAASEQCWRHGLETIFNPSSEVEISAGDFLIVMGQRLSLQELEQILTG